MYRDGEKNLTIICNMKRFIRLFIVLLLVAASLFLVFDKSKKNLHRHQTLDDLNLLDHGELHLFSDDGRMVSCRRTFVEHGGWHGECDGGLEANFAQRQDTTTGKSAIFGSFHTTEHRICWVAPNLEGESTVQCQSEDGLETDEEAHLDVSADYDDDTTHQRKLDALKFAMDHVDFSNRRRVYDDSGATLDLLVVWTPMAECINSGMPEDCEISAQTSANMLGLIDLAMIETNVAFSLSGIDTRLRLVHAYRDDSYQEPKEESISALWNTMVWHLTNPEDGELDSVHVNRALYGADLVHMIAGSKGTCGLSHVGPGTAKAFSVSRVICTTGHYSFGHEITHTVRFNLHHADFLTLFPWTDGYAP